MPFAAIDGQRVHYSDSGGDGPAVVFSHGFFMDHEMFAPQIEELRPTYRSLSVDARGFGLTESDGRPFTYWDLASDLIGVLDAVGIPQAVFVGLSQGGFTTLRVALQHPGRVRGIVLLDTAPDAEPEEARALYRQTRDALVANGWTDEFANGMASMLFGPDFDASAWVERWQQNPPERIAPAFDALIERESVVDRLGEITCPALVIRGELDVTMSAEQTEAMCGALPGCSGVVTVPGAGHTSNLENHQAVNEVLRTFVTEHA
jgi:pimeloyl-ACP methyl ester carboxylesterase